MNIYLQNKYTNWYYSIIDNAKNRIVDGYTEKHHIIPVSLGGNNSSDNLVILTAREHYIIHWLLTKMCICEKNSQKMIYAFWRMNTCKKYKINSVAYENNRLENSEFLSRQFLGIPKTEEHRKTMSKVRKGRLLTESWKKNISAAITGKKHPLYGIERPKEWNKKQSETCKSLPKLECIYCGLKTNPGNIGKWHNENCKNKPKEIA